MTPTQRRIANQHAHPLSRRHVLGAWFAAGAVSLAASACVTINIYFPAAAAEKAADRIIEEIYQLRKDAPPANASGTK